MLFIAMNFFLPIICMLCVYRSILGKGIYDGDKYLQQDSIDDFIRILSSCYPRDSCSKDREYDDPGISYPYLCSCSTECSKFGTCCNDAPYRYNVPPTHKCRTTEGILLDSGGYFMVQECSGNTRFDSVQKSQCEKEWDGENDILMITPVTSLDTSTTYKNYYCFRCHETTDEFILWNVNLMCNYENVDQRPHYNDNDFKLTYNRTDETWVAINVKKPFTIPVKLRFEIPFEIKSLPISCDKHIVSDCPESWSDKLVLDKCREYTSIVETDEPLYRQYKNPYCALCNSVSPGILSCGEKGGTSFGIGISYNFQILFNFNRLCEDDRKWDGKKCRKITCNMPEYVIRNGKCVPP